jgi:hypothetical protein
MTTTAGTTEQLFRFGSDSRASGAAREAVRTAVGDLRREILSDVLLCVTELVTHSVTQPGARPGDVLELRLQRDDHVLRVEIADRDHGLAAESARRAPGDPAFGLYIVELLADRWGVERGEQRRIWFEKNL